MRAMDDLGMLFVFQEGTNDWGSGPAGPYSGQKEKKPGNWGQRRAREKTGAVKPLKDWQLYILSSHQWQQVFGFQRLLLKRIIKNKNKNQ